MAACTKYKTRFNTALKHRNIKTLDDLQAVITKRAKSDREIDHIIHSILDIIEPPYCQKSHCPHHTNFSFCGCSQNLVPGKCPLNLEYLKNKRDREEKKYQERISQLPDRFLPLSKENETKVRGMSDLEFIKAIKKFKKQQS